MSYQNQPTLRTVSRHRYLTKKPTISTSYFFARRSCHRSTTCFYRICSWHRPLHGGGGRGRRGAEPASGGGGQRGEGRGDESWSLYREIISISYYTRFPLAFPKSRKTCRHNRGPINCNPLRLSLWQKYCTLYRLYTRYTIRSWIEERLKSATKLYTQSEKNRELTCYECRKTLLTLTNFLRETGTGFNDLSLISS